MSGKPIFLVFKYTGHVRQIYGPCTSNTIKWVIYSPTKDAWITWPGTECPAL